MTVVTVSPTYRVAIPKEIRRKLNIWPGQRLAVFNVGNGIELVQVEPMQTLRGRFPGLPALEREPERL